MEGQLTQNFLRHKKVLGLPDKLIYNLNIFKQSNNNFIA